MSRIGARLRDQVPRVAKIPIDAETAGNLVAVFQEFHDHESAPR